MKKAIGLVELLIVIVIITVLYFTFFSGNNYGRKNPFDDNAERQTRQEAINKQINKIENTKLLKQNIEKNLQKEY